MTLKYSIGVQRQRLESSIAPSPLSYPIVCWRSPLIISPLIPEVTPPMRILAGTRGHHMLRPMVRRSFSWAPCLISLDVTNRSQLQHRRASSIDVGTNLGTLPWDKLS